MDNPMSHLLYNSGLTVDLSQLEAAIQARRSALVSLPPRPAAPKAPPAMRPATKRPRPPIVEKDEEQEKWVPQKRNPNDLSTAAPVTCMEDFVKMPITTKLNNLKIQPKASAKGRSLSGVGSSVSSSSPSGADRTPPRAFPENYFPKEQDVVVDNAHYPNREFKNLIRQSLPNYLTASQAKRKSLVSAILSTVASNGGHFIIFKSAQQAWVEAEKHHMERFVAQSLQEAASQRGSSTLAPNSAAVSAPAAPAVIHPNVAAATRLVPSPPKPARIAPPMPRAAKRVSLTEQRRSFTIARPNPMKEIPISFRKRPSQIVSPSTTAAACLDDRSALQIKFKRPKTETAPRKVSLEPRNPLELLSQIAAMDEGESGDESDY